uniref:Integrase catalytic domain-containing protein n=1 Tax=Tanacetum cinerariifolium TaxID=118510 RepID=A0A6L2LF51_TANCI|nr:hypothetical protein [Tanacetum cinerariifolium]
MLSSGLESVEVRLLVYQQNESVFEEDIKLLKLEVPLRDNALVSLRQNPEKAEQEWDDLKLKYQSGNEYHAVSPPYTGTFMPPKPDLVFNNAPNAVETNHPAFNVKLSLTKLDQDLSHTIRPTAHIIEDWVSDSEDESETKTPQNSNPQHALTDKGVIDSGCSRHMTGNMSYLSNFEELNGGCVAFGGNPKGGKISGKDDYSRFTWVFFLATKDETSPILKTFITGLENQLSLKVKVIRSDNRTEFKNNDLNQFCGMKGIKREFSVPRTPQQNGIAERKNRTLIEAARTMLTDLLLPIPFWAEAVNTTCYVKNRVLVTKPHNKTPYELLHGRIPSIGFMRPFGCLVTILNTLDSLGNFDGKVDEIFLVGYSVSSKAFRVFNSRTRIVQETLHVNFLENKPNVAEKAEEEIKQQYVLFPVWSSGSTNLQNTDEDVAFDEKELEFEEMKPESEVNVSLSSKFEDFSDNSINEVNAAGTLVPAVGQISPNSTNTFSDVGPSNADVSPSYGKSSSTQTRSMTRVAKDQGGLSQMFNDDFYTCMFACFLSQEESKRVHQALKDPSWIEAMQDELLQFKMQKVWVLVNLPYGKRAIVARIEAIRLFLAYASFMDFMVYQMDVKSAFLYGTIEEEVYVCQPLGFEDPDYPDKVYKVVKALYGLHQAPRAWYETLANYLLENGFQRGKIDKTLFIKWQKGDIFLVQIYADDIIFGSTNKDLCKSFEKLMKDKFQMSSMRELTFFLGLQVKQKKDKIFISHDKYVAKILRKFGLTDRKLASIPIDTEKPLLKDPDGEDVDVHTYRSMIGSLMYFTSSRPDIILISWECKKQTVVATSSTEAEYGAAASCYAQVLWIQNQLLDYGYNFMHIIIYIDNSSTIVNTPRCDKDRLELMELTVFLLPSDEKVRDEVYAVDLQVFAGSSIKYALTVNPNIYVSCIKQFCTTVAVKKVNDITRLQALVDKKKVVVTKATIGDVLRLDDAEGVECLPTEEIFAKLARMGYEKPSTKLTFYKAFFLIQKQVGDLLTHTKKYTSPALTQKVFANMKRVGKGFFGVETPLFEGMVVAQEVREGVADEVHDEGVLDAGVATEGVVSAAEDVVPTADEEPSIPSPIPPTPPHNHLMIYLPLPKTCYTALTRRVEHLELDKIAQALEITKLKRRVKKLEKRNKVKVLKLQRFKRVGSAQRIDTSDDTVMNDVSNQGRMIVDIDEDVDVILEEANDVAFDPTDDQDTDVHVNTDIRGRTRESQAEIYKIDLDHANKVLSMQEEESEPAKLQEVVDIVTTAKIITEVVTAASTTIISANVLIPIATTTAAPKLTTAPSRRTKGVVIRDPEESTTTTSIIIHCEAISKDKGKGILKPWTEAQARKNIMVYLKNVAGFKMDYFKGMTYNDIRPVFEKQFDSNVAFLQKTKEHIDEEMSRAVKRIDETPAEKVTKRQKLDEEVKGLKRHLQIVPNEEDDVYTEATPLARKGPVVAYEIYNQNNKPYYKIIRADSTHQLYISFLSLLRNFDREDLEALWSLVKERFATTKPKNFFDNFLLITLGVMFEKPDLHAQI